GRIAAVAPAGLDAGTAGVMFVFFFSSRRRHTRSDRDWSSDVCSSDLPTGSGKTTTLYSCINQIKGEGVNIVTVEDPVEYRMAGRSEERRVGKECRAVGSAVQ